LGKRKYSFTSQHSPPPFTTSVRHLRSPLPPATSSHHFSCFVPSHIRHKLRGGCFALGPFRPSVRSALEVPRFSPVPHPLVFIVLISKGSFIRSSTARNKRAVDDQIIVGLASLRRRTSKAAHLLFRRWCVFFVPG